MLLLLLACADTPVSAKGEITEAFDADVDDDGFTIDGGDCNDHDAAVKPGATMFTAWSPRYQEIDLGTRPARPALADFDGDGDADVAVAVGGSIRIFRAASGRLDEVAPIKLEATLLAAADLDEDGNADLTALVGDELHLLRGDGALGFAREDGPTEIECVAPVSLAADARAAILSCADPAAWVARVEAGHLRAEEARVDGRATASTTGDWDADGDLDLMLSGEGSRVATSVINLGADEPVAVELTAWLGLTTVTSLDADGDGDDDVVFGHEDENDLTLLESDGVGGWATRFLTTYDDYWDTSFKVPDALLSGDFDGDGLGDVLSLQDSLGWMRWGGALDGDNDQHTWSWLRDDQAVGDVDGDGQDDVVVVSGTRIEVHLSRGDGDFDSANVLHERFEDTVVTDMDGDGEPDLLGAGDDTLRLHHADGTLVWASDVGLPLRHLAVGDVDGDGALDIVGASESGADVIYTCRGDGAGAFGAPEELLMSDEPNGVDSLTLADLDDDGDLDLVLRVHYSGDVRVLHRDAQGYTLTSTLTLPDRVDALAVGTLDDDDLPDLVVATEQALFTYAGRRDGTFRPRDRMWPSRAPRGVTLGDYDRDGIDEIAVPDSVKVQVYDAALTELVVVPNDDLDVVFADLSGDGRADLLVTDEVYLSDGTDFQSAGALDTRQSSGTFRPQDVDGDGDVDIVEEAEQVAVLANTCR